ncbi:MAG: bifunctional 4-hydroxy-3-methylbut-2-enyl diphosphate reductase/30S ribosomal protein S1 [Clostridia bacterium]|nr:bifunctional 4-hydroxy-3-methylbut-2-enyl diphosphate reductase/30S ribosomal protein S1 [Clostridia bacterium]
MNVTVAENAGFCFGVKRATDALEERIENRAAGERIYTLGTLIHNETYNKWLYDRGVRVTDIGEIEALAASATAESPVTVFVRAHGIPLEHEQLLDRLAGSTPYFSYRDCTCPFVKKIHNIAKENSSPDKVFILLGSASHPEVVGIMSYFEYEKFTVNSAEELYGLVNSFDEKNLLQKTPILAAQTTQNLSEWKKSQEIFKKLYTNALIFDTICNVTESRQTEAASLSRKCDLMVVIGGRESSNTAKLYSICKENCPQTYWIERPEELAVNNLITSAHTKVGIAAGASTPSGVIQEVYKTMSEMNENFAELLDATEIKTLNTGDTVTGTVTSVTDAELYLDFGAQVTGLIKAEQITDDSSVKLTEMYKPGDEIEAFVIRVSDVEGFAELSKKRVDSDKNWQKIVDAAENNEVLTGKVVEVVKGGVSVLVDANRVFVPASQTGVPKDESLDTIKGQEVSLKIIEIKGKRAIGSIRVVAREERRAREEAFWASMEEGKVFKGAVKSMTSYGAFVDLGGVDGMVHKSELSWKPIATPAAVLEIGQEIEVFVKSFDAEKKRISLGYKKDCDNPWYIFTGKYAVGDVASVKIVNMMPFGAFAEIVDGVDGLIHISQIAQQKIGKPADVLELGQVVDAKIIAIDEENQKVSLSIRALLDEAQAAEEAMPADEVVAEEAAADAE